jgi:hypothetical protein
VDLRQRGPALVQVVVAGVDVGLLRERRVVVPGSLADDGDRHACVLHERQCRVSGVVQGDPAQASALEQPPGACCLPRRTIVPFPTADLDGPDVAARSATPNQTTRRPLARDGRLPRRTGRRSQRSRSGRTAGMPMAEHVNLEVLPGPPPYGPASASR